MDTDTKLIWIVSVALFLGIVWIAAAPLLLIAKSPPEQQLTFAQRFEPANNSLRQE